MPALRSNDASADRRAAPARAGLWLCVAAALLGAVGLVDALVGIDVFAPLWPDEPLMRANTALGLFLVGIASALRHREHATRTARVVSIVAAIAVLVVALATLAEYALGVHLHMDRLLALGGPGPFVGRSPPLSALGQAALASAVLAFDWRIGKRARPREWFALVASLIGFTALLGVVLHAPLLHRLELVPQIGVAPSTAIGLLLTSAGVLLARPSEGLMRVITARGPGGILLRRLIPATIVGPAVVAIAADRSLRALGVETPNAVAAVVAASMTVAGLMLLVITASPLNRAHEALEASRAQAQDLVEYAAEGIFTADLDGRYTEVNDAACRMLGFERDEIVGKSIRDFIPESRFEELAREKQLLVGGEKKVTEWVLRKKDGSWLPVEVSAKILPDRRWHAVVRDISERKRLEAALQASHADLIRAQSVAGVGSWRLDVRRNLLEWSDEEYRMFGVPIGTPMTYGTFLACVHPDDRPYVDREWTAGLRGAPYDIEHRIVVDGSVRWVREKADLEFDEHHVLVGGIGVTLHITERKEREEELRQAQERLDLALRGADLALYDWNVTTGEVIFNARWAEMRGHRPDEIRGHVDSWLAGIHPDDLPRVQRTLADYFEGRRDEYECEHRVRTKSGRFIWILDRGKVFARDEHGAPTRMLGTELDITARKQAEEALRLAEAKAAGILAISADAIISIDEQQRITLFNDGAEKIFGYSKGEVLGAPLDMLIPQRVRDAHRRHVEGFAGEATTARHHGRPDMTSTGLRKNGEEFPIDAVISRLRVDGTTILTVALRDITREKLVEDEQRFLSEISSVLSSTLELDPTLASIGHLATLSLADVCIVYVVEPSGEVRRARAIARDPRLDWACDILTGTPLDPSRDRAVWVELGAHRSVVRRHVTAETIAAFSEGDEYLRAVHALDPASFVMSPCFAHGKLVGALAFIATGQARSYSAADVRFAEEIAQRAGFAIDNAQLYAASRRAIESRDTVLRVVAHDLRNPLGTILMYSEILALPTADAEHRTKKAAESIARSGKRMNRIIEDLLDVTRLEEGELAVECTRVSPQEIIADAVESEEAPATSSSVTIHIDVPDDVPEVFADRERLLQIFENLVGNALKFTPAGGSITLGASAREREVLFSVADTGVGVSAEDLPRLFDRFWQARKRDRRGLGLGLTIVKGLVEAHGGRIWAESTPGHGTTFFFTIPTLVEAEETAAPALPARRRGKRSRAST